MHNPFKTPAYEDARPTAGSLRVNALLLLLSIITTWMLTKDIQHLLSIYNNSLSKAAGISIFHYAYIKLAPLEIAYFRALSSIATLALIMFTARNIQAFTGYYFLTIAYGVTQLIYQALAISGVITILSQVAGRSIIDTSFWFSPELLPSTTQVLLGFLAISAPPILFIAICLITKTLTSRARLTR
ncbi:hypothetical protein PH586_07035 [Pseudomonas sp. SA3-5]|uniref:Uncharacterized protein n=1 Tax=Pseudomonas aestuarii TaxID=3018340 RepID=A0ABT4XD53_9PSED|nr:hypothetical protein [Pseudomonas aestuarii]MDA7086135.1 hypothetical protein [Pseudomonas aestuarii]